MGFGGSGTVGPGIRGPGFGQPGLMGSIQERLESGLGKEVLNCGRVLPYQTDTSSRWEIGCLVIDIQDLEVLD